MKRPIANAFAICFHYFSLGAFNRMVCFWFRKYVSVSGGIAVPSLFGFELSRGFCLPVESFWYMLVAIVCGVRAAT